MTLPFVRVVLVNYRTRDLTLRCLDHLAALDYPADRYEVVVVDNASDDGLVDVLSARSTSHLRVVALPDNRGFGAGCNAGIALDGPWDAIALVNNDSTPHPGWLDALVAGLDGPPHPPARIGAVGGKVLLAGTEPRRVNSAGCELRPGGFNADRGDGEIDDGAWDLPCEVFGFSGASVLLTKAMLDDVGLFDESLFLYYEDVDLVWRARRRGWTFGYAPGAVSDHDRGSSAGRTDLFWYHDTRNRLIVLARHAPLRWLWRALAVQLLLVAKGDPNGATRSTRLRAVGGLAMRAPGLVRERRRLDRSATVARDVTTGWLVT